MRNDAKLKHSKYQRDAVHHETSPRWAYSIDFQKCDIRRRMLAALELPA